MDFTEGPQEQQFRSELRSWLADHRPNGTEPSDDQDRRKYLTDWYRSLARGGWVAVSWPREHGGRGLPDYYELIVDQELARADAPEKPYTAGFLGRAVLRHASPDQHQRFLPSMLSGQTRWCEAFSEPDAGSDLANLRTTAVRTDDGGYVLRGSKVWTTDGVGSDRGLVLARTGPAEGRHRGLSIFVVDMHSPQVRVEPIVQLNGQAEFAEVHLDDVPVPEQDRVGPEGSGWAFVMDILGFERSPADVGFLGAILRDLQGHTQALRQHHQPVGHSARQSLGHAYVQAQVLQAHTLMSLLNRTGEPPGAEASVDKVLMSWAAQDVRRAALDYSASLAPPCERLIASYLFSRAHSVMGGTMEIQKDIIARQVLGLTGKPKEAVRRASR